MEGEEARTRYFIDPKWYEETNRSFASMAESRMCEGCQAKLGTVVEERVPTADSKGGKVVFELQKLPFAHDVVAHIRDCCGNKKGYIQASMPILEAVFRLFLSNGNQPLDADEIRQHLEWTDYAERIRYISPEALERVLANDNYYGFRRLEPAESEK